MAPIAIAAGIRRRAKVTADTTEQAATELFTLLPFSCCPSDFLTFFGADGISSSVSRAVSRPANLIFRCPFVVRLARLWPACSPPDDAQNLLRRWWRKGEVCRERDCKIKGRSSRCPKRARSLGKV
jgi:hypothetical protein